ncbi:undecaprenyl diphosphate synthase [Xanthobacter versatilis]|uniref:Isoprenyl transferase n=1 Tax=Xanthobacter autotrophicus (strain ATCC BAA-1158 / Py2) TaxID=78245 RepID=A7INR2_XANP2|nr:undecaprenyl diphosphate synthase [Xanthobacter autotrophicus Py2]
MSLRAAAGEATVTERSPAVVPVHVGVIMDGNGRWATSRKLPRVEGHRRGVEALRRCVRAAREVGIRFLTIYSFSSENWSRPLTEVRELMGLLKLFLRHDLADLHADNVRVKVIGERDNLAPDIRQLLVDAEALTCNNTGLTLVVAFNYGSRQEIAAAVSRIAADVAAGRVRPQDVDVDMISQRLETAGIPDPDLIVRTSGEQRLSNFLLWQAAYSEFVFLPIYWPDFDKAALLAAIDEYARRDRRFGGVTKCPGP